MPVSPPVLIAIEFGKDECRVAVAKGVNTATSDGGSEEVVVAEAQPNFVTFREDDVVVGFAAKKKYEQNCRDAKQHADEEEAWKLETAQECDPTRCFDRDGEPGYQRLFVSVIMMSHRNVRTSA